MTDDIRYAIRFRCAQPGRRDERASYLAIGTGPGATSPAHATRVADLVRPFDALDTARAVTWNSLSVGELIERESLVVDVVMFADAIADCCGAERV